MSIRVMTNVWENSIAKGSVLLLLLAIADNANDDGEAWPGTEYLAHKIRMSERQVIRLRQKLYDSGELEYISGGNFKGDKLSVKVCIKGDKLSVKDSVRVTNQSRKGDNGVSLTIIEPSLGRQVNTTAILTDSFVQDDDMNTLARSLVQEFKALDPEFVMRHVFEWKQALSDRKTQNIGGLAARLRADNWKPKQFTDRQRGHPFYIRHFGQYDFGADYAETEFAADASRSEYAAS